MMTLGVAALARTATGTGRTGRTDRLTAGAATATVAASLAGAWLAAWAIYRTAGADVLITAAELAVAVLGVRVLDIIRRRGADRRAALREFSPTVLPAVAFLLAGPAATAGAWARLGLVVPTTVAVVPTAGGGAIVTVTMRPGQHRADYAEAAPQLAAMLAVRAVSVSARGTRATLTLHP